MAKGNIDLIRRGYEAGNQGGIEAVCDFIDQFADPEIEFRAVGRLPDAGRVRGPAAVKTFFARLFESLDWHVETEEFIDAGDSVVVVTRQIARGKASGLEVTNRLVAVWGIRRAKVTSVDFYRTKNEALEAVGLRE